MMELARSRRGCSLDLPQPSCEEVGREVDQIGSKSMAEGHEGVCGGLEAPPAC